MIRPQAKLKLPNLIPLTRCSGTLGEKANPTWLKKLQEVVLVP